MTSRGSGLSVITNTDGNGDLVVHGLGTMDIRPGFRYVMATVNRNGFKSFNGKPLTETSGEMSVKVSGSVTYRQRIAMPLEATVVVSLVDVSRADAPAEVIAKKEIKRTIQVPIPFELTYDSEKIDQRHDYAVQAQILLGDKVWFTTTTRHVVITKGHPSHVDVVVHMVNQN